MATTWILIFADSNLLWFLIPIYCVPFKWLASSMQMPWELIQLGFDKKQLQGWFFKKGCLSLYEFKRQLEYKCKWYGRDLVMIDRWFPSSKLCSQCGYKYKDLKLDEREWTCSECHTKHDRDFNAATNILNEGKRIKQIGTRSPEFTLVDYPTMDDKHISNDMVLKSSDRLKQEENESNC